MRIGSHAGDIRSEESGFTTMRLADSDPQWQDRGGVYIGFWVIGARSNARQREDHPVDIATRKRREPMQRGLARRGVDTPLINPVPESEVR